MVLSMVYLRQVGLVVNLMNYSMSLQFHILFYCMLYTVVIIIVADIKGWIRLVVSSNSRIKVMLDQKYDPNLYYK